MMQIDGGRQIKSATITATQIAAAAGITDAQLATAYVKADGTRAMTGNLNGGGFEAQNFVNPTASTSLATKSYVDSAVAGLPGKYTARAGTNTETLTISGGSVTSIAGTTVDSVTIAVNDPVFIPNAPASTGAAGGATFTTQPANGLYVATAVGANITVSRASDLSGSVGPFGAQLFVATGATWGGGGFLVTTPNSAAAFTYGTGNIAFTQFSGAGEITTDTTINKSGNQLSRAAITGDVTISTGSNAAAIAANAVTYAKFQQVAANSLVGNSTGSTANAAAVATSATPAASTVVQWDANSNLSANAIIEGFATTTTSAGTTTLVVGSPVHQVFTGSSIQTVKLPTTGVVAGAHFIINNNSTQAVTVQSSGSNTILIVAPGTRASFVAVVATPTTAANWDYEYLGAVIAGGKLLTINNSLTLSGTDATTFTLPGSSDTLVGLAATQTLTGKTISGSSNTLSNIALASLASAAYSTTPTASTLAEWDSNKNLGANAFVEGVTSVATAAGTTTLVVGSTQFQQFTGVTTQTVVLPAATTMTVGQWFDITNRSSGVVTVNMNGGSLLQSMAAGSQIRAVLTNNGTAAGTWDVSYTGVSGGGTVTSVSVASTNGFTGSSSGGSTPSLTLATSVTGLLKGNGTALSAAVASTDYMAPSSFVTREAIGGTINGSNTAFTLANTPIAGTEQLFQNGLLLRAGAGNDYTISGSSITWLNAPQVGDYLCANYLK